MQHSTRIALLLSIGASASVTASAQTLTTPRQTIGAVSVGDLALFPGGRSGNMLSDVVDVYDDSTGTWSVAQLTVPRDEPAATVVGSLVLFAGGATSGSTSTNVIDVYDSSAGPPSDPAAWSVAQLSVARFAIAATTVGGKAFFAGGAQGGPFVPSVVDVVDVYDSTMGPPSDPAAWSVAHLSVPRGKIAAATVGSEALFAGGIDNAGSLATVDVYDDATGTWRVEALSQARLVGPQASTTVGSRAYFAGGQTQPNPAVFSDRIDVYDGLTGTWSQESLSSARGLLAATSVGDIALFGGGANAAVVYDVIDRLHVPTSTWDSTATLVTARADLAATTVGGKAIFVGGNFGFGATDAVDVVEPYVGERYCGPAVVNSTGSSGVTEAIGSPIASQNHVALFASRMPASAFGFFIASRSEGFTAMPGGSQGNLCLAGAIGRYVGPGQVKNSGASGAFLLTLDLTQVPTPTGLVAAQAGETWHFQAWHRDSVGGNATSNFTDAVRVTLH